jgi:thiamine-phosphate pyrophosphorylase
MKKIEGLYAIADLGFIGSDRIVESAELALDGGASVIQLRGKNARGDELLRVGLKIREIAYRYHAPFIINDRVDLVKAMDADGVHLGSDDLPCKEARELLGPALLIGATVHSLEECGDALLYADYLGVGPVYSSPTKVDLEPSGPELLRAMRRATPKSIIAIGGITKDKIPEVKSTGADGFAAISLLFGADDIRDTARECVGKWTG